MVFDKIWLDEDCSTIRYMYTPNPSTRSSRYLPLMKRITAKDRQKESEKKYSDKSDILLCLISKL